MGKDKTMAFKSLKFFKASIVLLVFFLIFNFSVINVFALDKITCTFANRAPQSSVGYSMPTVQMKIYSMARADKKYFNVKDKNGKILATAKNDVTLVVPQSDYPLTVYIDKQLDDSALIYVEVNYSNTVVKPSDTLPNGEDGVKSAIDTLIVFLKNYYDKFLEFLKGIGNWLEKIYNEIVKINDFLSNPAYLKKGTDDLTASVENLRNKNIVKDVGSTKSKMDSLGTSAPGSLPPVQVTIGGKTFNALDLSAMGNILASIRLLMTAIIWIEFSVFCIRVLVPKFKV